MAISPTGRVDSTRTDFQSSEAERLEGRAASGAVEHEPIATLQEQMSNAAEEMADILSTFGRFSRNGRKNDNLENDFLSAMLEDKADEKCEQLIKQVVKMSFNNSELLKYARHLFPHDSDLMLALRELLLSRRLSVLQKKNVEAAIAELGKFADNPKMQSGINIGRLAQRFVAMQGERSDVSARELRASYLRFLALELPAGYLYQDWIEQFGCHNRQRLLAFTLNALVADMKASEPGIHFDEFGPLCRKLSEARVIHSLDVMLNARFAEFPFRHQLKGEHAMLAEENIVALYMGGLLEYEKFAALLKEFQRNFMSRLLLKQRAAVMQALRMIFNLTPEGIYANPTFRQSLLEFISSLLGAFYDQERQRGIWTEYYR